MLNKMNQLNEFNEPIKSKKSERKDVKSYTTAKHAPVKKVELNESLKLIKSTGETSFERSRKYKESQKVWNSDYCEKKLDKFNLKRVEEKKHNRNGYKQRKREFTNISKDLWLFPETMYDRQFIEKQILKYSRKHKCAHGLWFTWYNVKQDENEYYYIQPVCDHGKHFAVRTLISVKPTNCFNCHQLKAMTYSLKCGCTERRCNFCKASMFTDYSYQPNDIYYQSILHHHDLRPLKFTSVTKNPWSQLPTNQTILEVDEEEFPALEKVKVQSGDKDEINFSKQEAFVNDDVWIEDGQIYHVDQRKGRHAGLNGENLAKNLLFCRFDGEDTLAEIEKYFTPEANFNRERFIVARYGLDLNYLRQIKKKAINVLKDTPFQRYLDSNPISIRALSEKEMKDWYDWKSWAYMYNLNAFRDNKPLLDLEQFLKMYIFQPTSYEKVHLQVGFMDMAYGLFDGVGSQLCSLFSPISEAVKSICNRLISGIRRKFEDVIVTCRRAARIGILLDAILSFIHSIFSFIDEHKGLIPIMIGLLYRLFTVQSVPEIVLLMAEAFGLYKIMQESTEMREKAFLQKIYNEKLEDYIKKYKRNKDIIETLVPEEHVSTQGSDRNSFIDSILGMFEHVVGAINRKVVFSYMREFNTVVTSARNISYVIMTFLKSLPTFVKSLFLQADHRSLIRDQMDDRDSPIHQYAVAGMKYKHALVVGNPVEMEREQINYRRQQQLCLAYFKDQNLPLHGEILKFVRAMDSLPQVPISSTTRSEPFTIYVTGESGVGKSTMTPLMLSACYPGMSIDEIMNQTYPRNPNSEFWDGFNPDRHKVVYYDDFNQVKEEIDLAEVILLVSSAEYFPPMASVDPNQQNTIGNKGIRAAPEVVIMCSNVDKISPLTLNSPEAINRRRHVTVTMSWLPGFKQKAPGFAHAQWLVQYNGSSKYCTEISQVQSIINQAYQKHKTAKEKIKVDLERFIFRPEVVTTDSYTNEIVSAILTSCLAAGSIVASVGQWGVAIRSLEYWINHQDNWLKDVWAAGAMVLTFATTIATFISVYKFMKSGETQSGEQSVARVPKAKIILQASEKSINYAGNVVTLTQGSRFNRAVFVKGNILMTNEHFFHDSLYGGVYIEKGTRVEIESPLMEGKQHFLFDESRLYRLKRNGKETDVVFYVCPLQIHKRPTIINHFNEDDLDFKNRELVLITPNEKHKLFEYTNAKIKNDRKTVSYDVNHSGKTVMRTAHSVIEYDAYMKQGDCGSLIMLKDETLNAPLIGIHFAAGSMGGMGLLISRQEISEMCDKMFSDFPELLERKKTKVGQFIPQPYITTQSGIKGEILITEVMERRFLPPPKSKIVPSPLFCKVFKNTTVPAKLKPFMAKEWMDPYEIGVNKYGKPLYDMDRKVLDYVGHTILQDLKNVEPVHTLRRQISLEEAVFGIAEYQYVDPVDLGTSAGYPYALTGRVKRDLINEDGISYELEDEVKLILKQLENAEEPDIVYIDTLKDERRPIEKVEAGKTRLFSMAPLAWTIVGRMLFFNAISWLYKCRKNTFMCVGIDRASLEWDDMARYLQEIGHDDNFLDMDYSAFDSRADLYASLVARKIIVELALDLGTTYGRSVLERFMQVDAQPRHLYKEFIISLVSGTSSGSLLTVLVNSILNEVYIRYAFMHIVRPEYRDIFYYKCHVRTKNYGDDLVLGVSKRFQEEFNARKLSEFLETQGIQITSARKGTFVEDFMTLDKVQFLKCSFGRMGGIWVPHMDFDAMVEPLNWIKVNKSLSPEEACEDNCNAVLRTVFFYGKEKFEDIREKILSHRPLYNLIGYAHLEQQFYGGGKLIDVDGVWTFTTRKGKLPSSEDGRHKLFTSPSDDEEEESLYDKVEMQSGENVADVKNSEGTLDEPAQVISSNMGVSLAEQKKSLKVIRTKEDTPHMVRAKKYNNDTPWDLAKMLSRWNLVDTFEWNGSQAANTVIKQYDVIYETLNNAISATPFLRFKLFRCERIKYRVEISGNRFLQGRLLVGFRPTQLRNADLLHPELDRFLVTNLPHGRVDPADNTVLEFSVPFAHWKQYLDIVARDCLGQLYFMVYNTLVGSATASTSCVVKLFMSIEEPVFKQPRAGGSTLDEMIALNEEQRKQSKMTKKQYIEYLQERLNADEWVTLQSGILDEVDKTIGHLIKDLEPADLVADALGYLLDKPQNAANPAPLVMKEMQYNSNFSNVDHTEYLGPEPSSVQKADEDHFSTKDPEMDGKYLVCNKPSLITTLTWDATKAAGDILWQEHVGPNPNLDREVSHGNTTTPPTVLTRPRMIDYVSTFFKYWRGSKVYVFEIVSSAFHEGKLDVMFHPNDQAAPPSYSSGASQYMHTHQLRNVGNSFSVTTPCLSDVPYKLIYSGEPVSDGETSTDFRFADFFSGTICLRVGAPLKNPSTVVSSVEINVYEYAAGDFEMAHTTGTGSSLCIAYDLPVLDGKYKRKMERVRLQAGEKDSEEKIPKDVDKTKEVSKPVVIANTKGVSKTGDVKKVTPPKLEHDEKDENANTLEGILALKSVILSAGPGYMGDMSNRHFANDREMCLKNMLKRYSLITTLNLPVVSDGGPVWFGVKPYNIVLNDPIGASNKFSRKVEQMFRLYRGSMCYKLQAYVNVINKTATAAQINPKLRGYVSVGAPGERTYEGDVMPWIENGPPKTSTTNMARTYFSDTQVAEFKVPFLSNKAAAMTYLGIDKVDESTSTSALDRASFTLFISLYLQNLPAEAVASENYDVEIRLQLWAAYGDESACGVFIGLPPCYIRTMEDDNTRAIWPDYWEFTTDETKDKLLRI